MSLQLYKIKSVPQYTNHPEFHIITKSRPSGMCNQIVLSCLQLYIQFHITDPALNYQNTVNTQLQ